MNFTLMPSLEHMTLVKITVAFWNKDDIQSLIANFDWSQKVVSKKKRKWQEIEKKVVEKVQLISLPRHFKDKILSFVKPIGLEIFKWKECHDDRKLCSDIDLKNALCWTPQGTVDKRETAKALINHENIDIKNCYRLACIYCLENDIVKLWEEMPEYERKCISSLILKQRNFFWHMEVFWMCYLKADRKRVLFGSQKWWDIFVPKSFLCAAVNGNISAVEYFWQKLTPEQREKSLEEFTKYVANGNLDFSSPFPAEDCTDVLCFLLFQMNEELILKLFTSCTYKVLRCLLDWPRQNIFMKMASRMWDLLSGEEYFHLLYQMVSKRAAGYKDCNYQKLLWEFWMQSPNTHKRYILQDHSQSYLMPKLLEMEDKESIRLILKDASVEEKEHMIFSYLGMKPCKNLMYDEKWDLLKFYIQECISSKERMIKFKEKFNNYIGLNRAGAKLWKERNMQNKFFQFMDNLIDESKKKKY